MAGAGGHDQVVISDFLFLQLQDAAGKIKPLDLRHQHFDVATVAQDPANRCGNFPRGQTGGGNLVQQRLEGVKILAIDQQNLDRGTRQRLRGRQAAKACSYDCHSRFGFLVHRLYIIRFRESIFGLEKL